MMMRPRAITAWLLVFLVFSPACRRGSRGLPGDPSLGQDLPSPGQDLAVRVEGVRLERIGRRPLSLRAARGTLTQGVLCLEGVSGRVGDRWLQAALVKLARDRPIVAEDFSLRRGALHLAGRRLELNIQKETLDARGVHLELHLASRSFGAEGGTGGPDPSRKTSHHASSARRSPQL